MLPVLTPTQMREVDRYTIDELDIPGRVLMEHAGRALARRVTTRLPNGGSVGVLCGKGNNGGDGFVAARWLAHEGADVVVYLAADMDRLKGDALASYRVAQRLGVPMVDVASPELLSRVSLSRHDCLVDCLLGTGIRGAVGGHLASVIDGANASGTPIIACDVPSGLDAETGRVEGACIRAAETLTIGLPKVGLLLYPGRGFVGELAIADIGFPQEAIDRLVPTRFLLERADATARVPDRPRNAHKGRFGRVLIVGGSRGMTGAAALAAEASLRIGAGLTTVGIPASLNDVLEVKLTEAMTRPLPETDDGTLAFDAADSIRSFARRMDVLAIGSGLSTHPDTSGLIRRLLDDWGDLPRRVVFDADALNAVAPLATSGAHFPARAILTPHAGEMARLTGRTPEEIEADRIDAAQTLAVDEDVILVLKGVPTVIAAPDGRAFLNPTGNPGMATGGSGDVLTGVLAGLLAQGLDPLDAAILGVYVHGVAGDLAAEDLGAGLLAGDITRALPRALLNLTAPREEFR